MCYAAYICDDIIEHGSHLKELLLDKEDIEWSEIKVFDSPDALLNEMNKKPCDILFMDIELGSKNGIDIVQQINTHFCSTEVIYVTNYPEYCSDVYDTKHTHFLCKPINDELLCKAITYAIQNLENVNNKSIVLKTGNAIECIPLNSIVMIESSGRRLLIHTLDELRQVYDTIPNVLKSLDARFCHCHKSYVINMDYISSFSKDGVILLNEKIAYISQRKRTEARAKILEYLGSKL